MIAPEVLLLLAVALFVGCAVMLWWA